MLTGCCSVPSHCFQRLAAPLQQCKYGSTCHPRQASIIKCGRWKQVQRNPHCHRSWSLQNRKLPSSIYPCLDVTAMLLAYPLVAFFDACGEYESGYKMMQMIPLPEYVFSRMSRMKVISLCHNPNTLMNCRWLPHHCCFDLRELSFEVQWWEKRLKKDWERLRLYSRRTSTWLDFFSKCGGWQSLKLGTLLSPHPTTQSLERIHFQLHSPEGNELLLTKRLERKVDKRLANDSKWPVILSRSAHDQVNNKLVLCKEHKVFQLQNHLAQLACTKITCSTCSTWTGKNTCFPNPPVGSIGGWSLQDLLLPLQQHLIDGNNERLASSNISILWGWKTWKVNHWYEFIYIYIHIWLYM